MLVAMGIFKRSENEVLKKRLVEAAYNHLQRSCTHPNQNVYFKTVDGMKPVKDYESSHLYRSQQIKVYCKLSAVKQGFLAIPF